jgi:hypothetical protein
MSLPTASQHTFHANSSYDVLLTKEEGAKRMLPSSPEISFTAEHSQHTQSAPQTMQNRTTNYVEPHHKTPSNRAKTAIHNHKQTAKHKQKSLTFTTKNFFCTQRNRLS